MFGYSSRKHHEALYRSRSLGSKERECEKGVLSSLTLHLNANSYTSDYLIQIFGSNTY